MSIFYLFYLLFIYLFYLLFIYLFTYLFIYLFIELPQNITVLQDTRTVSKSASDSYQSQKFFHSHFGLIDLEDWSSTSTRNVAGYLAVGKA